MSGLHSPYSILVDDDEQMRRDAARAAPRIEPIDAPVDEAFEKELAAAERAWHEARQQTADAPARFLRLQGRRRGFLAPRSLLGSRGADGQG